MSEKKKLSFLKSEYILLIPIMFAIAVIPLIVKFVIHDPQLSEYSWFTNTNEFPDMFMYCKQSAMIFLDGLLVLGLIYLLVNGEARFRKAFIPLGIYFVLIFLSSIVSVSSFHTWHGFADMMESAWVLFGYCMLCYYTFVVVKSEQQVKVLMFAFFIGVFILCLIGMFQFMGLDLFMTDFGKGLVFTGEYTEYKDTISSKFESGRVSSTLYNPNYVGVYSCIVIPVLLTLAFSVRQKKHILLYAILLALVACSLVGSGSKTAILTLSPCIVLLLIYFGRRLGKKMIAVALVVILAFAGLNIYQGENSVFARVLDRLLAGYTEEHDYVLNDITLNDDNFTITYEDRVLTVQYKQNELGEYLLNIFDEDGTEIPVMYSEELERYCLEDEGFDKINFQVLTLEEKQIGYVLHSEGCKFNICYSPTDQTYYYLNLYGRYTKMYTSEIFDIPLFHLMGGFSGRDYIWGKSIPILKETIFLGSGPDTYTFMFPQYDYIAAAQNGYSSTLITKPHNTYLQIGIQTGVLSLFAYIGFYLWYFVESVCIYRKRELASFTERCGLGIFIASICYMVAGLINDSTIGVSVIFWALIGLGHACNAMICKAEVSQASDTQMRYSNGNSGRMIIACCACILGVLAGHFLMHMNDTEPTDGRRIFKTNAIQSSQNVTIPYQAVMSVEWTFADGTAISEDAYVENSTKNQNDVYFDVKLESGEMVYTSQVIKVGTRLDGIQLEKDLSAGEYKAVVTYHLLGTDGQEKATAAIEIIIKILN